VDSFVQAIAATTRTLLASSGALQASATGEQIDADALRAALTEHLHSLVAPSSPLVADAAVAELTQAANRALLKVTSGSSTDLTDSELDGLEVIVQVLGRPALRYKNGQIQPPTTDAAQNERWHVFVVVARDKINTASASVARVNLQLSDGTLLHLGTGWRLGADLLVTNRHVVQNVVSDAALLPASWTLDPGRVCVADFAMTNESSQPQTFAVESLDFCANEPDVDLAVLRLRSGSRGLPPPLSVEFCSDAIGEIPGKEAQPTKFEGAEVYAIGHPLQRKPTAESLQVFGDADGLKRCCPGRTTAISDRHPLFHHDCSTLRGNSGSAMLTVTTHRVVGIHLGGRASDAAGTLGSANLAVAISKLGAHRLTEILANGRI